MDPGHGGAAQGGHVLAKIDRKIGLAVELVRGDRAARHLGQDPGGQRIEASAVGAPFLGAGDEFAAHPAGGAVIGKIEGAVLAHHAGHGPEPRDQIAPAAGTAGDRGHRDAGAGQIL